MYREPKVTVSKFAMKTPEQNQLSSIFDLFFTLNILIKTFNILIWGTYLSTQDLYLHTWLITANMSKYKFIFDNLTSQDMIDMT